MSPPERRRALIIGAGPTGMSAALHLGEHSLLLERRDFLKHSPESKTLIISCSSRQHDETGEHTLIQVERWRPPDLARQESNTCAPPSVPTLMPALRGELRMHAEVTRVAPTAHLLELANGHRYVYDKLLSTLSLAATEALVMHNLPRHVRRDETLRYWLSEHDIEIADRAMLEDGGDLDEFTMGKRFADQIGLALALKFGKATSKVRGTRLFQPRLVMP